jgi:hypothetical protein
MLLGAFFIKGYPIVFRSSEVAEKKLHYDSAVFNPLNGYKFNEGDWAVYLILDKSDFEKLIPELNAHKVWKASSISVLQDMQATWNFKSTGGDMATVSSTIVIVHDRKIVFESGVILDQNLIGLQGKNFGWAEPVEKGKFVASLREFKKVQSPFVFI